MDDMSRFFSLEERFSGGAVSVIKEPHDANSIIVLIGSLILHIILYLLLQKDIFHKV